jgi:HEAT repeat protein
LLSILGDDERRIVIDTMAQVDIVLACRAFRDASIRNSEVGHALFDIIDSRIADPDTAASRRSELAKAAADLVPFVLEETVAAWLEDDALARGAARSLGRIGNHEYLNALLERAQADHRWPSEFSQAAELLVEEGDLDDILEMAEGDSNSELGRWNLADVLLHFPEDLLLDRLSQMITKGPGPSAVAYSVASRLRVGLALELLARGLKDPDEDVRDSAAEALAMLEVYQDQPPDTVLALYWELLDNAEHGAFVARRLADYEAPEIQNEALVRYRSPRNEVERINAAAILVDSSPNEFESYLISVLEAFEPEFARCLGYALQRLARERVVPALLIAVWRGDPELRDVALDTLRMLPRRWPAERAETLGLDAVTAARLFDLWEQSTGWTKVLAGAVFAYSGSGRQLFLERLGDDSYPQRQGLLSIAEDLRLSRDEVSDSVVAWLIDGLAVGAVDDEDFVDHGTPAGVLGDIADERLVAERLLPLMSSSNGVVKSNAYRAIRQAEGRLRLRFPQANK